MPWIFILNLLGKTIIYPLHSTYKLLFFFIIDTNKLYCFGV